jgi:hypothetical protein
VPGALLDAVEGVGGAYDQRRALRGGGAFIQHSAEVEVVVVAEEEILKYLINAHNVYSSGS